LAVSGAASWAAGGVASFIGDNGAGAAALVLAGAICGVVSLMGRWPSRISMSGNVLAWEDVEEAFDSQIQVARASGESDAADLEELRERLATLNRTGSLPEHPAEAYDRNVDAAIRRLLPNANVTRQFRSRDVPDFIVDQDSSRVFVETKWRSDAARPFGGSTLPRLLDRLPPDAKLLVVINTTKPPSERASQTINEHLAERGRIVHWRDVRDDPELGAALTALLDQAASASPTVAV
jgi:hypothetical protein